MIDDPEVPPTGVVPLSADRARWSVWAPKAERVDLVLDPAGRNERIPMIAGDRGFFAVETPMPAVGDRYAYALDGAHPLADPRSRWQPDGINTPSAVYFPDRFDWGEEATWKGIPRQDLVIYELHVGTFTPEGTFDAVHARLDDLLDLGVTAVEIMPVAQFPGVRGWGYDGVFPFAVQNSYGGPEGLQRLVRECHRRGLAVFLDVIYNHFGPDGNVLPSYGPYLTDTYKTVWGAAVNYDGKGCDPVRAMVVDNVRMWLRDFHFDGLRLDASDQIYDRSPRHILADIATAVHAEAERSGRLLHIVAETDHNDAPRYLRPNSRGGYDLDGQWNDDFHHAVHTVLTGERSGYYIDFHPAPQALAKVIECGFVNDGRYSPFRGRRHGAEATEFTGDRLVGFIQNHDQVGNRMLGDRLPTLVQSPAQLRLAAGLLLLAPRIPLLFMGEEYGETNPFQYFSDCESPDLIHAVREGRKAEFAHFAWSDEPPDPFDPATRDRAVLSWSWEHDADRSRLRKLYRRLIEMRRKSPALRDFRFARTALHEGDRLLEVVRGGPESGEPAILFNLSGEPVALPASYDRRRGSFRSEVEADHGPEAVPIDRLQPHEFAVFEARNRE